MESLTYTIGDTHGTERVNGEVEFEILSKDSWINDNLLKLKS